MEDQIYDEKMKPDESPPPKSESKRSKPRKRQSKNKAKQADADTSHPQTSNNNPTNMFVPPMPNFIPLNSGDANFVSNIDQAVFYLHKSISEMKFTDLNQMNHLSPKKAKNQQQQNQRKENKNQNNMMKKSNSSTQSLNNQGINYEPYWDPERIENAITNKIAIQGRLRINQRSFEDAFVSDPNGGSDIYLCGLVDRNRALNNDTVVVKLKEKYLWRILDNFRTQVLEILREFESQTQHHIDQYLLRLIKSTSDMSGSGGRKRSSLSVGSDTNLSLTLIDLAPTCFSNSALLTLLKDEWFQRTGAVVAIIEKKNSRFAAGHLKLFSDKNRDFALFSPNDSRIPRMRIQLSDCPPDFYKNPQFYANSLFIARLVDVPMNSRFADGELVKCIGREGEMEVETEAILIENGIDYSEFDEKINECLPATPWTIPAEEFTYRRDLRSTCVFTIDPASARDLDDALHVIELDNGLYEVGVHIADVSYFVREDTLVDKYAAERTTSVYLVQKVIPMLPRLLCEHLCSLNPATDRLTFSVIWKINSDGDILEEWFGRSVINSAVKLSYEHAQSIIEKPDKKFDESEFPPIRPEFSIEQIKQSVLNLNKIAVKLRSKRFKNGCLVLNQSKISFILNKNNGMPYGFSIYQQKDSNRLVEEFMLLANIAVAHRIYEKYPEKAILRRHPTPDVKQLEQLESSIRSYGFTCDINSSNSIQEFLENVKDPLISLTMTSLLSKTMKLAQYFCSGGYNMKKEDFYHYGLAVPLYTHFTSPIRRYPDVLVHRLLAASLGYCELTKRDSRYLQTISDVCNDKKYSARVCSERSTEIYFSIFVNECGPLEEVAVVTQIRDHSFDVVLVNLGIAKRVYCDKLDIDQESIKYSKTGVKSELSFLWNANQKHAHKAEQKLELFSIIIVVLTKSLDNDPLKFNITLKHPNEKPDKESNLSKIVEEISETASDLLVTQRVDIDPYICD